MRINYIRGDGDRPAPSVTDELLTSEIAGIARAEGELDSVSSSRRIVTAEVMPFTYKPPGSIVSVNDIDTGVTRKGFLRKISVSYSASTPPDIVYNIEIEEIIDER